MWAIYWRYLLAVIVVFFTTLLSVQQLSILSFIESTHYQPSVFWLVAAAFSILFSLPTSHGLIPLFFGDRLGFSRQFWRRLNISFTGLFIVLALLGLMIQAVAGPALWANYKLYFQPLVLVFGPLAAGSFLLRQVKHAKQM